MANESTYVKIEKEELEKLESLNEEQEVILTRTKEYLYNLESINRNYEMKINKLNYDVKYLKEQNKKLKNQVNCYNSSKSWKITKPLRAVLKLFR